MSRTLKLEIKETAEELRNLLKKETNAQIKEKLHALYLLKSGIVTTLSGLSEFLVRDRVTIYRWFEKYKESGLTGLLKLYKPAGRSLSIPPDALEKLKQRQKTIKQNAKNANTITPNNSIVQQRITSPIGYKITHQLSENIILTTLDALCNWARLSSLWPL